MQTTTKANLRRLALGTLLAGGIWLGLTACDGSAHADDTPAAVAESPGGALGDVLDQTTNAVDEVVDQVLPEPEPTKAPEPEPTTEPEHDEPAAEPEPSDEPGHGNHGQDEQQGTDEPADTEPVIDVPPIEVPVDLPPIVIDVPPIVVDLPPVVVDVPPVVVVTPPVAVPPVVTPTPAPTQPANPAAAQPTTPAPLDTPAETTTEPAAAEPLPAAAPLDELSVVIGPVAGSGTLLPGLAPTRAGDTPQLHADEPQCTGDRRDQAAPDHGRGVVRTITDRRTGQPDAQQPAAPAKPCPAPTGPGDDASGLNAALAHPTPGADQPPGDTTATLAWPTLDRLHQLRARGDLPASRSTHLEPGPA
ncbi:hypothetical protein AB0C42_24185 [Micromonospora taraxaci]|uniref:hypothetical protein n=1 Tax=Micromonospora taraxaci TaxID=1316803 RepID=UPI003406D159